MKNEVVSAILSIVITTLVYTLVATPFFKMDNALGEGETFVVDDNYKTTMTYSQQQQAMEEVETECKSPCPKSSEMCIAMCINYKKV